MRTTLAALLILAAFSLSAQSDTCHYTKTPWAQTEYCKPVVVGEIYYTDEWIEGNFTKRFGAQAIYIRAKYMVIQQCHVADNRNCPLMTHKRIVICK